MVVGAEEVVVAGGLVARAAVVATSEVAQRAAVPSEPGAAGADAVGAASLGAAVCVVVEVWPAESAVLPVATRLGEPVHGESPAWARRRGAGGARPVGGAVSAPSGRRWRPVTGRRASGQFTWHKH